MLGSKYSLVHPKHKPQFILVYLFILYLASIFTWDLLTTLEATIIGSSNRLTAIIYDQPLSATTAPDLSYIHIESNSNLNILIQFPDGKKTGYTSDNIRYTESDSTNIKEIKTFKEQSDTSHSLYLRQITTNSPPLGNYRLSFTTSKPGTYPVTIRLTDRTGTYTKEIKKNISLNSRSSTKFFLKFHKDLIERTQFKEQLTLSSLASRLIPSFN